MRKSGSTIVMAARHKYGWPIVGTIVVSANPGGITHVGNLACTRRYSMGVTVKTKALFAFTLDYPGLTRKYRTLTQ